MSGEEANDYLVNDEANEGKKESFKLESCVLKVLHRNKT